MLGIVLHLLCTQRSMAAGILMRLARRQGAEKRLWWLWAGAARSDAPHLGCALVPRLGILES